MADAKLTALTANSAPVGTDIVYLVDDPGGTPLSQKMTLTTLKTALQSGGGLAIKLDELAATTDVTTLNASITAHGLLPKLSNVATEFLTGTGTWAVPGGADTNAVREYYWPAAALLAVEPGDAIAPLVLVQGTNADILVRAFDDTTAEGCGGTFQVPSDVQAGSTITFRLKAYAATAPAGAKGVVFAFKYIAVDDAEVWDAALSTETSGALTISTTTKQVEELTWTETLANLGWAALDTIIFHLYRQPADAADDLVGDAYLIDFSVEIPRA